MCSSDLNEAMRSFFMERGRPTGEARCSFNEKCAAGGIGVEPAAAGGACGALAQAREQILRTWAERTRSQSLPKRSARFVTICSGVEPEVKTVCSHCE